MHSSVEIDKLHSIRFRNTGYKRKRILSPAAEQGLLNFLKRALGENVFLVSTGLGLDVYYLSSNNHTDFITKNLWLFHNREKNDFEEYFQEELTGKNVLNYFNTVVVTLTDYPQLFLSCCKKLIRQFNIMGVDTPLNNLLYACFDNQINTLLATNKVPFAGKIIALRNRDEYKYLQTNDAVALLVRQYAAENHNN